MRFKIDPLAMAWEWMADSPFLCSFSSGSSGSQSGKTKVTYNKKFLEPFYGDFPQPIYSNEQDGAQVNTLPAGQQGGKNGGLSNITRQQFSLGIPKFQGLEDMDFDKLQSNLYNRQLQNLTPTYETERARRREELSQTGLLNSPVAFAEGGALDSLERNYFDQNQKAASDAAIQTVGLKQQELARKLGFDMDLVRLIESIFGRRADIALGAAGSKSSGERSSGGQFDVGAALGAGAGLFGLFCWVALAIYGPSQEFIYARSWIVDYWTGPIADLTRWIYAKTGRRVASLIYRYPVIGRALRPLFNIAVRRGKAALNAS